MRNQGKSNGCAQCAEDMYDGLLTHRLLIRSSLVKRLKLGCLHSQAQLAELVPVIHAFLRPKDEAAIMGIHPQIRAISLPLRLAR